MVGEGDDPKQSAVRLGQLVLKASLPGLVRWGDVQVVEAGLKRSRVVASLVHDRSVASMDEVLDVLVAVLDVEMHSVRVAADSLFGQTTARNRGEAIPR